MRSRAEDRDSRHYCRFHRDYGHDIEECYDLKNQIEDLMHRSHLDRYIMKPRKPSLCPKRHNGQPNRDEYPDHDDTLVVTARITNTCVRIKNFTTEASEASLKENLDMLEEHKAKAHQKNLHYHRVVAQLYNQRIQPQPIGTGDLVLRRAEVSDPGRT
ncbi:hypothetical protein BHE74_00050097 [Ensete ventricosum]|nr:hypothetical protein BHE74_00050097 [Ensete ventricosum]